MRARHISSHRALLSSAVALSLLALTAPLTSAATAPGPTVAAAAAAAPAVEGEWGQFAGGAAHTGVAADTTLTRAKLASLAPAWSQDLDYFTGASSAPVVSGGLVYLVDSGLSAYRVADGSLAWRTPLPGALLPSRDSAAVQDGVVVVGGAAGASDRRLHSAVWGLDAATGALLWTRRFDQPVLSPLTVSQQAVYVTVGGRVQKLRLQSGRVVWTSDAAASQPASIDGNRVLVSNLGWATLTQTVSSLDDATGATRWTRQLRNGGGCFGPEMPVVVVDHVGYASDCSRRIRALGTTGGLSIWDIQPDHSNFNLMTAIGDLLITVSSNHVVGYDRATGAVQWSVNTRDANVPTATADTLLLASTSVIDLRDPQTGALLGSVALPQGGYLTYPVIAEGHLFVLGNDGHTLRLLALAPPA